MVKYFGDGLMQGYTLCEGSREKKRSRSSPSLPSFNHKVRRILTSSAECAVPRKDTSETVILTISTPTAIDPKPASKFGIRYYPNPATHTFTIDSLQLRDKWETLELFSTGGKLQMRMPVLNNF